MAGGRRQQRLGPDAGADGIAVLGAERHLGPVERDAIDHQRLPGRRHASEHAILRRIGADELTGMGGNQDHVLGGHGCDGTGDGQKRGQGGEQQLVHESNPSGIGLIPERMQSCA